MPIRCFTAPLQTDDQDYLDPEYYADPDELYEAARDREDEI